MTKENMNVIEVLQEVKDEMIKSFQTEIREVFNKKLSAERDGDHLLSKEEAATYLNIRPCTLSKWITESKAPKYTKLGSRTLFRREWLDAFIENGSVEQ